MNIYTIPYRIQDRDVNSYRYLRTSTLFELLQEISILHTEELGAGRTRTLDRGLLWVVVLQRVDINRMPVYDEQVTIESWPGNTMHLLFPRYYRLSDNKGKLLMSGSALWALIDAKTRRMVFPDRYGIKIGGVVTGDESSLPSEPKHAEQGNISYFTVPFSYVDLNCHMNNTRYFDLAEDLIPAAAEGRQLTRILMSYANEAKLGDRLQITWREDREGFLVSGDSDKKIFRMLLTYAQANLE